MAYLKAKHEYDAFKLAHLNQSFKDEYYKAMYDNDDYMLNTAPTILLNIQNLESKLEISIVFVLVVFLVLKMKKNIVNLEEILINLSLQ